MVCLALGISAPTRASDECSESVIQKPTQPAQPAQSTPKEPPPAQGTAQRVVFSQLQQMRVHDRKGVRVGGQIYRDRDAVFFFTGWEEPILLGRENSDKVIELVAEVRLEEKGLILTMAEVWP